MKKCIVLTIILLMILLFSLPAYAVTYDLKPFEDNDNYTVEFDDMDDTGVISLVEGGTVLGSGEDGGEIVYGTLDIRILEDIQPVLRLTFIYSGDNRLNADKIIIKPAVTRYTFDVDSKTEVVSGKTYEWITLAFSDESIQMLQDIVDENVTLVKCRFSGDRSIDFSLMFSNEELGVLLDDYRASGSLDNSFSVIKSLYPCTIKK